MQNITQIHGNSISTRGAEPLDLIKGHLTDLQYIPVSRGLEQEPKNWFRSSSGFISSQENHFVAKLQAFESGGYEITITRQDLKQLADRMDAPRATGKRVKGDQNENDVISSVQRSKRKIRHLIKSMGCDRLLTLTKRENDPDSYWTVEEWAKAWDRFNRACKKMGVSLVYVAVLEKHKKGNYHLHAAIVGRISVKHIRKIWLACCGGGKGSGNVDIQMKQGVTQYKRRAGLAKYVSKYVSKQIGQTEFNKKRYWSTRHTLPEVRRIILNSPDLLGAVFDIADYLGLSGCDVLDEAFVFPDGLGAWFNYDEALAIPPPF